jgi:hypothetical protein
MSMPWARQKGHPEAPCLEKRLRAQLFFASPSRSTVAFSARKVRSA